jgi:hypothetical protein
MSRYDRNRDYERRERRDERREDRRERSYQDEEREYRRERAVIVCFTCNQPGHYSTACPSGTKNKLLESELRDLREKEAERVKRKEEKQRIREEATKFRELEEKLKQSVNQTLQPILEAIHTPEKVSKRIQKAEEEAENSQFGALAQGELITIMKGLTEQINRLGAMPQGLNLATPTTPTQPTSTSIASTSIPHSGISNLSTTSAKRPAIMDELATKIATFGKLIGRGTGWKAKARDLGSLVNIELDFDNNSRDQIIQILAHAHIK